METITLTMPEPQQLPPSLLSNIETGFKSAFEQAEKWRNQALALNVTSLDQKAEMKLARTMRLELRDIRIKGEKTHKEMKADYLQAGKAIDGVKNLLIAAIAPLERHLEEQELFGERLAEAERLRLKAEREALLMPYLGEGQPFAALEIMSAEQWDGYLSDAKLLHAAKIEAARKAEAERIAKEQAEAAERERLRIENERLKAEALEREAKAKADRESFEEAQREEAKRQNALREVERVKLQAAREAREKLEAEIQAKQAAEAQAVAAQQAAVRKAAAAPDKEKLLRLAADIRELEIPTLTTEAGRELQNLIQSQAEKFAVWVETQQAKLN